MRCFSQILLRDLRVKEIKMPRVYALLDKVAAIEVVQEVSKKEVSDHPLARRIIDQALGEVAILTTRPQDLCEERTLCLHTETPKRTTEVLSNTPGVLSVAHTPRALTL
jgi:hypothetical protein